MKSGRSILAVALAGLAWSCSGMAATITVGTFDDVSGSCSLRDAVASAYTQSSVGGCVAGSGNDTIRLSSGTYKLYSHIEVRSSITIDGASTISNFNVNPLTSAAPTQTRPLTTLQAISKDGTVARDRLFVVYAGAGFTLNDLIVTGGNTSIDNSASNSDLPGVPSIVKDPYGNNGGAIWSAASLTISNVQFTGNMAGGSGGAIFLSGQGVGANISLSAFLQNVAGAVIGGGSTGTSTTFASAIGTTCFNAQAPETHSISIDQSLFYRNRHANPPALAPAVQLCGNYTLEMANDTLSFNDVGISFQRDTLDPTLPQTVNLTVGASSVSLTHLTVIGQQGAGIDASRSYSLSAFSLLDSVIAFNGNAAGTDLTTRNCMGPIRMYGSGVTPTIQDNFTGEGCEFTGGKVGAVTTNTAAQKAQFYSSLSGGVFVGPMQVNPNLSKQFYLPSDTAPDSVAPFPHGGLTGVYFPRPASDGGILVDVLTSSCSGVDQRGAPRSVSFHTCTPGSVEPKRLLPQDDGGQNQAADGAARTVRVSLLNNDQGDETGAGLDGERYMPASVHGFDPSRCSHLGDAGGTISVSPDGSQLVYQPLRPNITLNGKTIQGPGLLTSTTIVCPYFVADNAVPANVSQVSANVSINVVNLPPAAVGASYVRPYNGDPFYFNPVNATDPDGIDGKIPDPVAPPPQNNIPNDNELKGTTCSTQRLVTIITAPSLGTISGNIMRKLQGLSTLTTYYDGNFTYTPHNSFSPFTDSFQYAVLDADCAKSNAATVTIATNAPDNSRSGGVDSLLIASGLVLLLAKKRKSVAAD